MSDPSKRLIAEFRAAMRPPADVHEHTWAKLQLVLDEADDPVLPSVPPIEEDEEEDDVVEPSSSRVRPAWVIPFGVAVAVAAALILSWRLGAFTPQRQVLERSPTQAADVVEQDEPDTTRPRSVNRPPAPRGELVAPAVAPSPSAPSEPEPESPKLETRPLAGPPTNDLAAELALMRAAKQSLDQGNPQQALQQVREHARRFPDGTLQPERRATEVRALCALGRHDAAKQAAQAFAAAHPNDGVATALASRPCATD